MRVKDCAKCPKHRRRVWSSYYRPLHYHPIGMSHAYAWCTFHEKRCREVKKCDPVVAMQVRMEFKGEPC